MLQIGDIVTVIDERYEWHGMQGEVVEIKKDSNPDGPIGVRFHSEYRWKWGFQYDRNNIMRFEEKELRKDAHWDSKNWAKRLFGDMYHSVRGYKDPLNPETICEHERCRKKVTKRIMIDIWGTAIEVDVCDLHAKYHGRCIESFPWKKSEQTSAAVAG